MSRRSPRLAVPSLGLALALVAGVARPARAQQAEPAPPVEGLDVVLLVDVSRSMFTGRATEDPARETADGSDPQRLRWNAVQLVLNLLSAEDRVLIVPFNDQAPAQAEGRWFQDGRPRWSPGLLPQSFLPMGDRRWAPDPRVWLRGEVEAFILPDVGWPPPNIDIGGTAILPALKTAADLSKAATPPPGRRVVAILLTDGREDFTDSQKSQFPNLEDDVSLRGYLKPWSEQAAGRSTPVYTIGLGTEAKIKDQTLKLDYLRRIALSTGGNCTWIQGNDEIIDTFRDLIWQLKGCWIKTVNPAAGRTDDTMRGITELGILSYCQPGRRLNDGRPDPRNTDPPRVAPALLWGEAGHLPFPPDRPPVQADDRHGKDGGGYLYWYFGRHYHDELSPFQAFFRRSLTLTTTWDPPAIPHRLYFAKRTARPLFEVVEPVDAQSFPRHQPLVVRLRLTDHDHFKVDQFRVSLQINPQTERKAAQPAREADSLELRPVRGSTDFEGSFPLDTLPQSRGEKDFFTLRLMAEGLPVRENALDRYHLELPPRTIAVDNTLVFEDVPSVMLTDKKPIRRIALQSRARVRGDLKIRGSLMPRREANSTPLPDGSLRLRATDPAGDDDAILLRNGAGSIEVALEAAKLLPGVEYDSTDLSLTAADGSGRRLLTIPVAVSINRVELGTEPPESHLEAGQRSGPIKVVVREGSPPPDRAVRVVLAPRGSGRKLVADELWIEPASRDPAKPPAGDRSQSLELPVGDAFRVVFEPRSGREGRGRYLYEWRVSAPPWAIATSGLLTAEHQPPRLSVPTPLGPIHMGQGGKRDVAIPVRLEGLENEACRVEFRPKTDDRGQGDFIRQTNPGSGSRTTAIRIDLPRKPLPLVVGPNNRPAEGVLHLGLSIPGNAEIPVGEYSSNGILVAADEVRESPTIALKVIVNTLEVLQPTRDDRWEAAKLPLEFGFWPQREDRITLRIRTGLRDQLDASRLRVKLLDTLVNDDGHRVIEAPEVVPPGVQPVRGDPSQLELTIRFPGVRNPIFKTGNAGAYRCKAELRYDDLELARDVEFKVTYFTTKPTGGE